MADDAELNAQLDPMWTAVLLRARGIRNDTLAAIAEKWITDRDEVMELLDQLADTVEQQGSAWDAAVTDAECDLQMGEAHISLDETRALQLADELRVAAGRTLAARLRTTPIPFPNQQDRSAA